MKLAGKTDIGWYPRRKSGRLPGSPSARARWPGPWCATEWGAPTAASWPPSLAASWFENTLQAAMARGEVPDPQNFLNQTVAGMNRAVHDQSLKGPEYSGMGTTAVCALVQPGR